MPNIKSAAKRAKTSEQNRIVNMGVMTFTAPFRPAIRQRARNCSGNIFPLLTRQRKKELSGKQQLTVASQGQPPEWHP